VIEEETSVPVVLDEESPYSYAQRQSGIRQSGLDHSWEAWRFVGPEKARWGWSASTNPILTSCVAI